MKTEGANVSDVIWSSGVELSHLTHEECFPVIGDCQVSSILSNLNPAATGSDKFLQNAPPEVPQAMELIVLQNSDYKIPPEQPDTHNQAPNEFIVKNNIVEGNTNSDVIKVTNLKQNDKKHKKNKTDDNFEDVENILYFVCNLCPYLCIKDSKITEHLANEHKSKTGAKLLQLKCPACPNVFYHKIPLRSHLVHDHQVNSSDLKKVMQAVLYFAKKGSNAPKSSDGTKNDSPPTVGTLNCKNEVDLKYIEKLINTEKIINNEDSASNGLQELPVNLNTVNENGVEKNDQQANELSCKEMEKITEIPLLPQTVSLPMIDITHNDAAKTFATIIKKRPDTLSKLIEEKKYHKCTLSACKVRLQDSGKMGYHIKCHEDESFRCPECNEPFVFWKPLTSHLWRLHKIDMELYACDKCDYKTFSMGKLNNIHKLIHSDFKAFACDVCQKAFKNSKQLRNHKPTHKEKTVKLIHVCEICAKPFSDRRQLRIHVDGVHNKIKPFLCSYCGYKGASKSALKMHIRQHTGEKPFACNICEYTTADHNSLRRHKLRHTGHKPYKCAHCDYACIQSSTYKAHLRTKHPGLEKDLLFTCPDCQFKTVNKEMYLSHLFLVHRQKVSS